MKKLGITLTMIAMLLTVGMVYGQDAVQKSSETVKLSVDGSADLDFVYRDSVMEEGISGAVSGSTNFYTGKYTIRFTATVDGKADVVIELENKVYDAGGISELGDDDVDVDVEQGFLRLHEFLDQALTFTVGVQDLKFSNRKGESFFMDVTEAESFFQNVGDIAPVATAPNTMEPVGFRLTWTSGGSAGKPQAVVDFVYLTIDEGGSAGDDEALFGANLSYLLPQGWAKKDSYLNLLVMANSAGGGSHGQVWTLGVGLDMMDLGMEGLEAFVEAYFQMGEVSSTVDAEGNAFVLGGKYSKDNVWVELAYWNLSGDDDAADGDEDNFLSYENVEEFAIIESRLGFDIDTNYRAFKVSAGATLDMSGKRNLDLSLHIGIFDLDEDTAAGEDNLGTEVDVKAKLAYSKAVTFDATIAFLSSSDVLEDATDAISGDGDDSTQMYTLGASVKF